MGRQRGRVYFEKHVTNGKRGIESGQTERKMWNKPKKQQGGESERKAKWKWWKQKGKLERKKGQTESQRRKENEKYREKVENGVSQPEVLYDGWQPIICLSIHYLITHKGRKQPHWSTENPHNTFTCMYGYVQFMWNNKQELFLREQRTNKQPRLWVSSPPKVPDTPVSAQI